MAKREQSRNGGNRALCYVRVSTVEQSKFGFSLDAQEERLRAYCRMAGLEVAELIREEFSSSESAITMFANPESIRITRPFEHSWRTRG